MVLSKRTKHLHDIAFALRRNGLVIFPCDTILGILGRMTSEVVMRINAIKERPPEKPYLVLVPTMVWVPELATSISDLELELMNHFWPGPVTLLLDRNPKVDASLLGGSDKIALRWPAYHPLNHLLALVKEPLFSTSINKSGQLSAKRYEDIPWSIEQAVDAVFETPSFPAGSESALIKVEHGKPVVLRGQLPQLQQSEQT